ncbi:MAG TPA: phospholipid carrier-dependent glycosyltransferase [Bacteroidia bacterium]|nr:phospholipid carrier-dependent glycosyltransferase [Bacteroidia bacterium]
MSHRSLFLLVFSLAMALRLMLCLLNREANDNHMEAIALIADNKSIPESWECAECFQPKAFYLLSAGILIGANITDPTARIITIQLLNLVFSFFILLFVWKYLRSKSFSDGITLLIFSMVALNPSLAGINAQITNDTIVILMGTGAIYYLDKFIQSGNRKDGWLLGLFVLLSPVVKGSGIVLVACVFFVLAVRAFLGTAEKRKPLIKAGCWLAVTLLVVVPFAGGYYSSYVKYGTPFSTGIGPKANVKQETQKEVFHWRPGYRSLREGFLTFRLAGMLQQPYINNDTYTYPLHRTSLWSQLYGRTFFMHFDQHPPSWQNRSPVLLNAGRLALVLGLIPALLLFVGVVLSVTTLWTTYSFRLKQYIQKAEWHHLVFIAAYIAFIMLYARSYPDFSTMKSIFIFPAIPAFCYAMARGMSAVRSASVTKLISAAIIVLLLVHVYDISFLIRQLI